MAILPIRLLGDPVLRQQTRAIESVNNELKQLIGDMMETMHNAAGVGLAAVDVGLPKAPVEVDRRVELFHQRVECPAEASSP